MIVEDILENRKKPKQNDVLIRFFHLKVWISLTMLGLTVDSLALRVLKTTKVDPLKS